MLLKIAGKWLTLRKGVKFSHEGELPLQLHRQAFDRYNIYIFKDTSEHSEQISIAG